MDNRTIFIQAALAGDFGLMKKMLDKGHDVNDASDGETAFSWCCDRNALASAKFLYEHGAEVNLVIGANAMPLDIAVCRSSPEFRSWLRSVGATRLKDFNEWDWPHPEEPCGS